MHVTIEILNNPEHPSLRTVGFAAKHVKDYVNESPDVHSHDVVEVFYVTEGWAEHVTAAAREELFPGTLGIVNYGQSHSVVTRGSSVSVINLFIDNARHPLPTLPEPLRSVLPSLIPFAPSMGHDMNRVRLLRLDPEGPVGMLLEAIQREGELLGPAWQEAMRHYFQLFLMECARHAIASRPEPKAERRREPPIHAIRHFLDEHFQQPITLEMLAGQFNLSRPYLCRLFRREVGRTIVQYLHQRRVEHAMALLDTTSRRVVDIAMESGFTDLSHFNTVFRKLVGMSPGDFRKRELTVGTPR